LKDRPRWWYRKGIDLDPNREGDEIELGVKTNGKGLHIHVSIKDPRIYGPLVVLAVAATVAHFLGLI